VFADIAETFHVSARPSTATSADHRVSGCCPRATRMSPADKTAPAPGDFVAVTTRLISHFVKRELFILQDKTGQIRPKQVQELWTTLAWLSWIELMPGEPAEITFAVGA